MDLQCGQKICGFTVVRIRESARVGKRLVEMVHDKTGAELAWGDSGEENKLFSVAFKTIPEDSTGVFHILEHSVLCGSDRFPVKEPFVDLLKSSMNTFLNAMTYQDKTVYPVSSRNEKDFLNLTRVYLDAVFAPALLHNKSIFYQEGRHIELTEDGPIFNGVVFNEMKGALSDVNDRIEEDTCNLMFPDNCYCYNSGGDPAVIPDLTYEKFAETYKRFYHPSNARIYLDGDLPLEETLGLIAEYLDRYERAEVKADIPDQVPVSVQRTAYYELDEEGDRDILVFGKILGRYDETVRVAAAQVLCSFLASSNESPLKRALLSKGLCQDVDLAVSDGIPQPYMILCARNTRDDRAEEIRRVVHETVEELCRKGLDEKDLIACVNRMEFNDRQTPEPAGLYRCIAALSSWLYGGDPLLFIESDGVFAELRKMIREKKFEALARELFLSDEGLCTLHLLPSKTYGDELRAAEQARLEAAVGAMTDADKAALQAENDELHRWQQTPDSKEQVEKLPKLPISEISEKPTLFKTRETARDGARLLYHDITTHGIVHLSCYFPLTALSAEELSLAALIADLYTDLPTAHYSVSDLQREIKTYVGDLSIGINVFAEDEDKSRCTPCLSVRASFLEENALRAQELIGEILTGTRFDEKDRVAEIVKQTVEENRQGCIAAGHRLAMLSARSHYSAMECVTELTKGYSFMKAVSGLNADFDRAFAGFRALAERMQSEAVCRSGAVFSVTADREQDISCLLGALPEGKQAPAAARYVSTLPMHMGIEIPAQVSYAGRACDLQTAGMEFEGSVSVAANILSLSYLWAKVRVQGGAYGAGMMADRTGAVACYSYRDPSPAKTLEVYDGLAAFLRSFAEGDEEELDKFIISAVGGMDPLETPAQQGAIADSLYLCGVSDERRIRIRREMIATDRAKLAAWCRALETMRDRGAECVVANAGALEACKGLEIVRI